MADSKVNEFLSENNVHPAWKSLILNDEATRESLSKALSQIPEETIPDRDVIFKALSYRAPDDIKLVVLGHDPIPDDDLATGLAFSFPRGDVIHEAGHIPDKYESGRSLKEIINSLAAAGIISEGKEYDCCLEQWAERGVLLFNVCLTMGGRSMDEKEDHWDIWKEFTVNLLFQLFQSHNRAIQDVETASTKGPLFVLCWGSFPNESAGLLDQKVKSSAEKPPVVLSRGYEVNFFKPSTIYLWEGHHPTYHFYDRDDLPPNYQEQARVMWRIIDTMNSHRGLLNLEPFVRQQPVAVTEDLVQQVNQMSVQATRYF